VSPALDAALKANARKPPAPSSLTLAGALLGALLGGLILNLMPCVFPVLAIKVVGFTRHAEDRRAHRRAGLAYTAGVVLSFLALGALMLGLRAAGEQLGWGFQLQSPAVVAALAALFTVIGLNLAGVFEFGSLLPSSVASLQAKTPRPILPVGRAGRGHCLALHRAVHGRVAGLCRRAAGGAGAAGVCRHRRGHGAAVPGWPAGCRRGARWLPRPGAWMDTFRKLMAFPMFATVAWLVWVLGQQSGIDGAGALLALLVALSLVVWALTLAGRARCGWALCPSCCDGAAGLGRAAGHHRRASRARHRSTQRRSRARLAALGTRRGRADRGHRPAGVCGLHRRLVRDLPVQQKDHAGQRRRAGRPAARNVALLRADWTRRDPPSPPRWPRWAAAACRCMCSTAPASRRWC
jgi:hypothetical protein